MKRMEKGCIVVATLFLIGCFFVPTTGLTQENTYIVQKGDTLWDICEKFYGDPDLWPELWQLNPFITNPHLLEPGDVIVLFEKKPVKKVREPEIIQEGPPAEKMEPEPEVLGVNIDGLTDLRTIGFLKLGKIRPSGSIIASDNDKLVLNNGDTAYVLFDKNTQVLAGDEFSIGASSPLLMNPVTGKEMGYTFSVNGKLVVEKRLGLAMKKKELYEKENVYKATITEVYKPIYVGNIVIPVQPISSCVYPVHYQKKLVGNIVATKDQQVLIHPNSIVYIDLGFNQGINRGNIFQVVKGQSVKDPEPEENIHWYHESKIFLSDIMLGRIMILESRPNTSTAIVLSATESFSPGVYIKNMSWPDVRDFLASRASCPIK